MFRVIGCVTQQHSLGLVFLAAVICVFACVTAMGMFARARNGVPHSQLIWLAATGVVAGAGIWATHFVAMLAFRSDLPISYQIDRTATSIVIAIVMSTIGFAVASRPRLALAGGAIVGIAIATMHFVGMSALDAPAIMAWDASYVAASIVIAIAATAPALHFAVQPLSLGNTAKSAGLFALGICGLHFTAMSAVTLTPTAAAATTLPALAPASLAVAVAAVTLFIVAMGFISAIVDQHLSARSAREAERLRIYVAELEKTKSELEATSVDLMRALNAASAGSQAKSQFLAAMSHELRTPLNAVIGFSEMLVNEALGPLGDPRYKDYAGDIRRSGGHLLSLINDILDLTRLDADRAVLNEERIDWRDVVAETLGMVRNQAASAGITLGDDIEPGLPMLCADRRRVMQVLLNLASNAVKFTPPGGSVRVSVKRLAAGVAVSVADTGIGMAAEDIPKALERFGQIDSSLARKYEGTGLGLPLAKQLMELHGGTLSIESEVTVGTTVTVLFPNARLGETDIVVAA